MSNAKAISGHRRAAYLRQSGRCLYCGYPMWLERRKLFARRHGLTHRQARWLRCTAEHVIARCDGGSDDPQNIVAACWYCNQQRHACREPLDSLRYLEYVRRRVACGGWHLEGGLAQSRPDSGSGALTSEADFLTASSL